MGQVALVTGGGTGIGAASATRLARAGMTVIVAGRRQEPLDETVASGTALDGEIRAVAADLSTEGGVRGVFEVIEADYGRIDVLVNNAAVAGEVGNIWELSLEGWEEALRINLTGPWLCTRAAAQMMREQRDGRIINIGSISGKRPLATRTPYTTTKLGLLGMTKTCALELGDFNVNVNLISPGAVETPRLQELADKWGSSLDELRASVAQQSALKRVSTPEDIAECVHFLASPAARNITGADITVDAGTTFI